MRKVGCVQGILPLRTRKDISVLRDRFVIWSSAAVKIFIRAKLKNSYIRIRRYADVQIVGVPDPKYGEELMAWIIPKEGVEIDEESVKAF